MATPEIRMTMPLIFKIGKLQVRHDHPGAHRNTDEWRKIVNVYWGKGCETHLFSLVPYRVCIPLWVRFKSYIWYWRHHR